MDDRRDGGRAAAQGRRYACSLSTMRATWDALAAGPVSLYVGDPARAAQELESLFSRLGGDPPPGLCLEVGCGPGRMTVELARRFEHVLALDVSPAMVERARTTVSAAGVTNVEVRTVSGERLDGVPDGEADSLVCYLVLQHVPRRGLVLGLLREFARVLAPRGQAFVQLPVLARGLGPRAWRVARSAVVPAVARLTGDPARAAAFRCFRLTQGELDEGIQRAGLRVRARDEGPDAPYRYARDVFLRLERKA